MYRPLLHYTASKNWISDPNGCIHVGGVFHLFYQHNPQSCGWGDIYWGHAVSEDLLHWKEQEIVLFPHPDTGLPFSGSAVLDKDNLSGLFPMNGSQDNIILIYTGHIPTSFSGTSAKEHQCIAYSLDAGSSFVPYRGNPVESSFIRSDFRDPKVFWYPQTNMWIMLVAANNTLEFYHSVNLIEWNLVSTFIPELNFSFKNLECPDIISVPLEENFDSKMWMITICIQYEQVANNQVASLYIIGDFDGHTFTQREPIRKVDYGSEFYAMQSWNNAPEGSCRWIGWVRDWLEDSFFINRIWRGVMSIPRELRLRKNQLGGHDLIQIPYLESIETQLTSTNFEGEIRLPLVSHQAYIIDINRVGMDCNGWCHFSLLGDEGDSLSIEYNDLYQHLNCGEKLHKDR